MNFLNSLLLASSFFLASGTYTAASAAPAGAGLSKSGDATSTLNTQTAEASLTQTLRETLSEGMDFPGYSAEPTQEVIVRIKFQVDADNKIDLLEVSGSNRRINTYVMDNLQGKSASEQPILPGVTFVSTLRFIL
ncbi:MAG: hypothetical protein GC205_13680 [Bacteroidetes bacterium]|nr:hypothetical protein [Bacteroidota bacterium]